MHARPDPRRKPWEEPISYTDEPPPPPRTTDNEPLDYSRGPHHDDVLGEEADDPDEPEGPPARLLLPGRP